MSKSKTKNIVSNLEILIFSFTYFSRPDMERIRIPVGTVVTGLSWIKVLSGVPPP